VEIKANTEIRLLNEFEVADLLRLSVKTVRRWRSHECGPKYLKVGRLVKYRFEAIQAFVDSIPTRGGSRS
jgi:predicted DNA-binding transcriptional regulator AlpA